MRVFEKRERERERERERGGEREREGERGRGRECKMKTQAVVVSAFFHMCAQVISLDQIFIYEHKHTTCTYTHTESR